MSNFIKIRNIRKYLTIKSTEILLLGLVISHLDYCNSSLYGLPDVTIKSLQLIQNLCAKLILKRSKYSSSSEALRELHWLPIRKRIQFKILSIVYRCLNGVAPEYLKELLTFKKVPERKTRSSHDKTLLEIPNIKLKTFAARSFSVVGPSCWNQLPRHLRNIENYQTFKVKLKTYMFYILILIIVC